MTRFSNWCPARPSARAPSSGTKKLCAAPETKSRESIHAGVLGTMGRATKHTPVTMAIRANSELRQVSLSVSQPAGVWKARVPSAAAAVA
jgi:hypothetical protein